MADLAVALQNLAELIGILDDKGVVWTWFGGPRDESLKAIYANRDDLAAVIAALAGSPTATKEDFQLAVKEDWKPFFQQFANVGVVWSDKSVAGQLKLGVGAQASGTVGTLSVVAWLFDIDNATPHYSIGSLAGTGECSGLIQLGTATGFLDSVEIDAVIPDLNKSKLVVTGSFPAASKPVKTLAANSPQRDWDFVRLGAFVLGQYIQKQSSTNASSAFFARLNKHLLPLLNSNAADPTTAFPAFQDMASTPSFKSWTDSFKPTGTAVTDNAGTKAFLWHLRALITGNEDAQLFSQGGLFSALASPPAPALPTGVVPNFAAPTPLAYDKDQVFVGVRFDGVAPAVLPATLIVRQIKAGNSTPIDVPLFQITSAGLVLSPVAPPAGSFSAGFAKYDGSTHILSLTPDVSTTGLNFHIDINVTTGALFAVFGFTGGPSVKLGVDKLGGTFKPSLAVSVGAVGVDPISGMLELLRAMLATPTGNEGIWLDAISSAMSGDLVHGIPQLMAAALKQAGQKNFKIPAGPLTFTLSFDPAPRLDIEVTLDVKTQIGPIYVGTLDATVGVKLPQSPSPAGVDKVQLKLADLRINPADDSSLAGSLLPDFLSIEGASLSISGPSPIAVGGGGRIAIQRKLGPLDLQTLDIKVNDSSLAIGLDGSFDLAGVTVETQDFGLAFDFNTGKPSILLKGLGLSADFGGIRLAGAFGDENGDYLGAASVSVFDVFQLSAIGGYTQMADKSTSMFLFASLNAPIGGPPFCFVTGIAGGFGYNRLLPALTSASDNPFMQVMRGEIKLDDPKGGIQKYLTELAKNFEPHKGSFWIAAGLQFTSFAFINGKLLATIGFNPFALQIMGSAGFGIADLAYFELEFMVGVDSEKLLIIAGLTHNTYLIDPGLFGITGQFGLGVWHSGEHEGDFVLSVGGYHPCYPPPSHYPKLDRVAVRAVLWDFVHITVSCFFACTPRELMAGASVSLWADFIVKAGLDVYVDVYIRWDPFFLRARMGICVWFEFFGRHEIGVDLDIHTPPFGGVAHISLFIISFDVSFGSESDGPPPLPVADFVTKHLRLPAKTGTTVLVPAYATKDKPGLWRMDVGWGRTTAPQSANTDDQEGLSAAAPIAINCEFGLVIRTKLPLFETGDPTVDGTGKISVTGKLQLPLCQIADLEGCVLAVTLLNGAVNITPVTSKTQSRHFPASLYGDEVTAAQGGDDQGREAAVKEGASKDPTVLGIDVLTLDFPATLEPPAAQDWKITTTEEVSKDVYPLPFTSYVRRGPVVKPVNILSLRSRTRLFAKTPLSTLLAIKKAGIPLLQTPPGTLPVREAAVPAPRRGRTAGIVRAPGAAALPDGTPIIAVPRSPVRRPEMAVVSLRSVASQPARANPTVPRLGVGRIPLAPRRATLIQPLLRTTNFNAPITVATGHALHIELSKGQSAKGNVQIGGTPQQLMRVVFLGAYGRVTGDTQVRGPSTMAIPAATRRMVLIGEESDAPLFGAHPTLEPMGIESDTPVLALEGDTFAAHGCVLRITSGQEVPVPSLSMAPGSQLLRTARRVEARFASPVQGSLVVILRATALKPAPIADQVRWRSLDATLGTLRVVSSAAQAALLIPVDAKASWTVELDVGRDYRIESMVAVAGDTAALATSLSRSPMWSFIDEHFVPSTATVQADSGHPTTPAPILAGNPVARAVTGNPEVKP